MAEVLRAITGQIDYHWNAGIWPRIHDLSDAEYLWEPVPQCWTLRPAGDGLVSYNFAWPPPAPAPFTTIAWRLCHIAVGCFAERGTRYFPEHMLRPWTTPLWDGPIDFPIDAGGALEFLDNAWRGWRAGLEAGGEAGLWEPLGDREGDLAFMQLGAEDPFIGVVLHVHQEVIHHGAEILLLRDLYRTERSRTVRD